ncbi:hypothetical protein BpHYR1_019278 [Brachionus plicatilis]|uniref:Uncharacterized protein n=1 Tax=Brachionus plicatilis TaxID=10195 RepID=A0A3M7PKW4_BRAPC|nr:hypothetical protein BpHYR1_019278 [Brachionus plicatilis]
MKVKVKKDEQNATLIQNLKIPELYCYKWKSIFRIMQELRYGLTTKKIKRRCEPKKLNKINKFPVVVKNGFKINIRIFGCSAIKHNCAEFFPR